jgi:hypothetical protein
MRIHKGDQSERDRNYARNQLRWVEAEIECCKLRYFAALPFRNNETMDKEAAKMKELKAEAERLRRILVIGG